MKARGNILWRRSFTTTPLRAVVAVAVIAVTVSSAKIAFGATGDGGMVTTCLGKVLGTWRSIDVTSGQKCLKVEQQFTFYTKEKVDSLVGSLNSLTQAQADARYLGIGAQAADSDKLDGKDSSEFLGATDKAANSDKLDGMDSSAFMPLTNCIGYPRQGIDWHGCNLGGANLTGAYLGDANLTFAYLAFANLTGAYLSYANLTDAYLLFANLTDANLSNANLTDAYLFHVVWSNTTCPDGTNSDSNGGTCFGH